jgi:hypothetical protein
MLLLLLLVPGAGWLDGGQHGLTGRVSSRVGSRLGLDEIGGTWVSLETSIKGRVWMSIKGRVWMKLMELVSCG